jgi:Amt family ammonium transporter
MMSIPGLALFYGGLVRTKNMLSVLMQVFMIVSVAALSGCSWGYSASLSPAAETHFIRRPFQGFPRRRRPATTYAATFSNNVYLPEYGVRRLPDDLCHASRPR